MTHALTYAIGILMHTPWWVWLILLAVTALGLRDLRPRRLSPYGMAVLPLVSLVLTLLGFMRSVPPSAALAAWALLAMLGAWVGVGQAGSRQMTPVNGQIHVSGSWFSLLLGWSIFAVQYAQGVLNAIIPGLRADALWVSASFGFSGFILGLGLGWLVRMRQRLRLMRSLRPAEASGRG